MIGRSPIRIYRETLDLGTRPRGRALTEGTSFTPRLKRPVQLIRRVSPLHH